MNVSFLGAIVVLVVAASEAALACPICFQVEENATTDGIQAAVLVLMGVTTVVLGGFAKFIAGFVVRQGREAAASEGHEATTRGERP